MKEVEKNFLHEEHMLVNTDNFVLPKTKTGRIKWQYLFKTDEDKFMEYIELQARDLLNEKKLLFYETLDKRLRGMGVAVYKYYPGGIKALKDKLQVDQQLDTRYMFDLQTNDYGIPTDSRGRNFWSVLQADNPDKLEQVIKLKASGILSQGIELNFPGLKQAGMSGFGSAINTFYPGGLSKLRQDLGLSTTKPRGYWTDIRNIENEAIEHINSGGKLTEGELIDNRKISLARAISTHYPGGIFKLRETLGIENSNKKAGYWTTERIEKEAELFYQEHGDISYILLKEKGKGDLASAIARYSGKISGLRKTLDIETDVNPANYWTIEQIEEQSRGFLSLELGELKYSVLEKNGFVKLSSAIANNYPGGLTSLKSSLGLEGWRKPTGYWTQENIRKEALSFFAQEGELNQNILIYKKRRDLLSAIQKKYPGGMVKLKSNLEVSDFKNKPGLESIEEQLLKEYNQLLQSGEPISFDDFLRRKQDEQR